LLDASPAVNPQAANDPSCNGFGISRGRRSKECDSLLSPIQASLLASAAFRQLKDISAARWASP